MPIDDPTSTPVAGDRVGRYVLQERLGAGGMGLVHAAWDPELGRKLAIKLIRPGDAGLATLLRRRLRREAQAMARLRHANVVTVFDVGESDGHVFVAMEFVDGVSSRRWLRAEPRSVAEILRVFRAAGEGLAAAHGEGLIHRDFKPDNVLVARDGRVLVADFGLASWTQGERSPSGESDDAGDGWPEPLSPTSGSDSELDALTKPGAVLGTPNYMAPEQRRARTLDARTDQFAFCVALWQALTGELPYGRSSARSLARARTGKLPNIGRKDVPAHVERALRRGLTWDPDERFPDMRALLDALEPPRRRTWLLAIPIPLALAAAIAWPLTRPASEPAPSCSAQTERVHDIWHERRASELAQVVGARSELARAMWPFLRGELDRWSTDWMAVDGELCDRYAFVSTPGLRERQLLCLDQSLHQLDVALDLLASASADELQQAFDMLAELPDPQRCREPELTGARSDVDPQELGRVDATLDRLALEAQLGRYEQVERESAELLTVVQTPGFERQQIRLAELRSGALFGLEQRDASIDAMFVGLSAAERDGSASLRLRVFINLVAIHLQVQDLAGAKRWLAQAKTLAAEQTPERWVERDIAANEGWVVAMEGRLPEGVALFERALALTDPEREPLEHEALTLQRAQVLGYMQRHEDALASFEAGERELTELMGPGHPEVLAVRFMKAKTLRKLERFEQARSELLAVAEALDELHGRPVVTSVDARINAAWALDQSGDCKRALAEFDAILPDARALLPYPSPDLGEALTLRAMMCEHANPQATSFAREALELYRTAVGDQHVMVASARSTLARTLYMTGDWQAALAEIEAALAISTAIAPIGAERVDGMQALAMVLRHELGRPQALDGLDALLGRLPNDHWLQPKLAALR